MPQSVFLAQFRRENGVLQGGKVQTGGRDNAVLSLLPKHRRHELAPYVYRSMNIAHGTN